MALVCVQVLVIWVQYLLTPEPEQLWQETGPFNCSEVEGNITDLVSLCQPFPSRTENPLLTLVTTVKDWQPRRVIHLNTLRNWKSLPGEVKAILFLCNADGEEFTIKHACSLAWDVVLMQHCEHGIPELKSMMRYARTLYTDSTFIGFANADLLFDETLPNTLKFLDEKLSHYNLFVGRRTNAWVSLALNYISHM